MTSDTYTFDISKCDMNLFWINLKVLSAKYS